MAKGVKLIEKEQAGCIQFMSICLVFKSYILFEIMAVAAPGGGGGGCSPPKSWMTEKLDHF